jgi:phosphatidylserine decarboxylase
VFAYHRVRMPLGWRLDVLETTSADRQGVAQAGTVDE